MRVTLILLLGFYAGVAQAQPVAPTLTTTWEGARLHVVWSAPEPGCLVLEGGGLRDARLSDVPCAPSGEAWLATGGVDYAYAPHKRTSVALRAASDLTRTLARAPTWRSVLPVVMR